MNAEQAAAYQRSFVGMAITMSWQLALVVILPIVGGHLLDDKLHTYPWLLLTGLVVAAAGIFAVLWQTVAAANSYAVMGNPKGPAK